MSTFDGFLEEFPGISIDNFSITNLNASKIFFLSHCHADHMVGLRESLLYFPGHLYTSEISAVFLKKQYPNLEKYIQILEIDTPTELSYDGKKIVVTALPAQHCPGSVMFILETDDVKILYTGDFRLSKESVESNQLLCSMKFDHIYLDSTFLRESFQYFPTQLESINIICDLIKDWIKNGSNHRVILEVPAQYGYEYLFMEIKRKLNVKIFNEERQLEKYLYFPDMDDCISFDLNECSVLVKPKSNRYNRDRVAKITEIFDRSHSDDYKFRIIKPSAFFWNNLKRNDDAFMKESYGNEVYRVCYSNHSSLMEIKDFLKFLKFDAITLNCLPDSFKEKAKMYELLRKITNGPNDNISTNIPSLSRTNECNFNNISKLSFTDKLLNVSNNSNSDNLLPKRCKFK